MTEYSVDLNIIYEPFVKQIAVENMLVDLYLNKKRRAHRDSGY